MKKEFIEEIMAKEIKRIISESVSSEVYIIKNKEGDPIEQFKTQEEADKALEAYKAKHPDQELIVEPGKELSFEELDKMSEKLENMENMNEASKKHKGHFTMEQVLKLAKKAGDFVLDAQDALEELCEMYGEKIPASEVFEVLENYDMPELMSKIRVKKTEPKEDISMDEKLSGNQDKLDVDGDGEIEASDLAALRAGKKGDANQEEGECMECGSMEEEDMEDPQFGDIDKLLDAGTEEDMAEEKHTCEKCGKDICECGYMRESKNTLRLNESELIKLITNIVNESFPGAEVYGRTHKDSGKQNADALSDVEKKIREYLNFDGNDNPEFPNQVGGEIKARIADEKETEEVDIQRGGGMEDLDYDVEPGKEFNERVKKSLVGDKTTGNSHDAANATPSKLGEKIIKKVERKNKKEKDMVMYNKDVQPTREVKESVDSKKDVISEEIKRIKEMTSYNKKTQ
jgi:hypothetical protein